MGADEAMGLQGVDTSQLWAYGQEALRVELGPRHSYLSLSLAGPMSFCLQKIRACSCSQAKLESGSCLLPAVRALAQQVRPQSESFSLLPRDWALPQVGVIPGPFRGNRFPTVLRCPVLPPSCHPIPHHHNGLRCNWCLQTRNPQLVALWTEPPLEC